MSSCPIPFTPVQGRYRRDGWTVERQKAFIEALCETGCFEESCRRVGMSDSSAYRLALRDPAFEEACEAARDFGIARLEQAVFARASRGVARPIFHKGEQVGEYRHFDERLAMFLLRTRKPGRYGKWIERLPSRPDEERDPALRAIRAMDQFEDDDDLPDPNADNRPSDAPEEQR